MVDKQTIDNSKGSILIIDDEKLIQSSIAGYVNRMGYTAVHAYNARDVMAALDESTPVLILLDIFIPGENTLEILQLFRHYPELKHSPVIIISGTSNSNLIVNYLREGAADYIQKPFNAELFRRRLVLAMKNARDSNESVEPAIQPELVQEKDQQIKQLQLKLSQVTEDLALLKQATPVSSEPAESNIYDVENLRKLLSETTDKLHRTVASHRASTEQLEHDLNNVLLGITSANHLLEDDSPDEPKPENLDPF